MNREEGNKIALRMGYRIINLLKGGRFSEFAKYAIQLKFVCFDNNNQWPIRLYVKESPEYRVPTPGNRTFYCDWVPDRQWKTCPEEKQSDLIDVQIEAAFMSIIDEMNRVTQGKIT